MNNESKSLLTLEKLLDSVNGIHVLGTENFYFSSVQTDSRLVEKNTLFVPLIGENQDGHKFIPQAIEKGASVIFICLKNYENDGKFFVELSQKAPNVNFIAVENTLTALQKAAGCYVEKFPHLIKIGITGSSGKTTTKEILVSILSQKYKVIANKGNFNSETGLPLSVFNIRSEHECGVFEMGMNRQNEIAEIASVLKPRFAIITNIGTAHIGLLGSQENIANEKAKIFNYFNGFGTGVIPFDDKWTEFLKDKIEGKVVLYGQDTETVKFIADLGLSGTKFTIGGIETILPLPGKYNYKNALGAISLAQVLGVSSEQIATGISSLKSVFGRNEIIEGDYTIIQDCYNANPDSMEKSIDFASSVQTPNNAKKIFVLGDMLELGKNSEFQHKKIGELALNSNVDFVIFIGTEMKVAFEAFNCSTSKKSIFIEGNSQTAMQQASDAIKEIAPKNSIILIKGSRGMGLERITKLVLGENYE